MKMNWERVWKSFNQWYDKHGQVGNWEAQQKEIEKLVNKQLKRLLIELLDGR